MIADFPVFTTKGFSVYGFSVYGFPVHGFSGCGDSLKRVFQRKESREYLIDLTTHDQPMMFAVITLAHMADEHGI